MRFECVSRTHVGLKRTINEDCVLVDAEHGLWAVADGMGGHECGEVASTMVIDALRGMQPASSIYELTAKAADALERANRRLLDLARSQLKHDRSTIGTTVVGLGIASGAFSCFWMGDSRCYQYRNDTLTRVTHDHSVVQTLVDAGLLDEKEADTHQNANLITRAIGADEKFQLDKVQGDAKVGDQFLLASDGLTRVVRDNELATILRSSDLERAADQLLDLVMERGAPDNVSLIIVKIWSAADARD